MTTSQCSKSHPSRRIVSLGGRFDQLGFGSLSDDVVELVEKHPTDAGESLPAEATNPARGRRRWNREREERDWAVDRKAAEVAVDRERERKELMARVLGREREKKWVAMVDREKDWGSEINPRARVGDKGVRVFAEVL